jgi:hypothetical protein
MNVTEQIHADRRIPVLKRAQSPAPADASIGEPKSNGTNISLNGRDRSSNRHGISNIETKGRGGRSHPLLPYRRRGINGSSLADIGDNHMSCAAVAKRQSQRPADAASPTCHHYYCV